MNIYKFRVYCEIVQEGVDAQDAATRLRLNINDSSDYHNDPGVVVLRPEKHLYGPEQGVSICSARIARLVILDHEESQS